MSYQGVHGTGRVLGGGNHQGYAGWAKVMGQVSGGTAEIRSGAAPQVL